MSSPRPREEVGGSGRGVSRPRPRGEVGGSGWGVQAPAWGLSQHVLSRHPSPCRRLLMRAARILLECILVLNFNQ